MDDDRDFDPTRFVTSLRRGGAWIVSLLQEADAPEQRPSPGKWSLVEILAHLVDEEREDFRPRLRLTLEDPSQAWPAIDPEGWVTSRGYAQRSLGDLFQEFREERRRSLRWLEGLGQPNWHLAHSHPSLGKLRAGDLLCAWALHDHLHARQILRTRWQLLDPACDPFTARYAEP